MINFVGELRVVPDKAYYSSFIFQKQNINVFTFLYMALTCISKYKCEWPLIRTVIQSLWPLPDEAGAHLTTYF